MNFPPIVNRWQVRQHIDHARTMARDLARSECRRPDVRFQLQLYAARSAHNAIVAFQRREPITTTTTTNQGTA